MTMELPIKSLKEWRKAIGVIDQDKKLSSSEYAKQTARRVIESLKKRNDI